jgi:hypothetical protein
MAVPGVDSADGSGVQFPSMNPTVFMRSLAATTLAAWLAGCAMSPAAPDPGLFEDARFAPPTEGVGADQVFALSEEMRAYLRDRILEPARIKGRQVALVEALYAKGQLRIEYDSTVTRNASEAFAARAGNCLSLVVMTSAFAKELGLSVSYQKVLVDDMFARDGDFALSIGHVNLTLGRSEGEGHAYWFRSGMRGIETVATTIDFLPPKDMRSVRTQPVGEAQIVAMFMNNRAVEAMIRGNLDDAYWWARGAIAQAPDYLPAYNTLGVVYLRHGDSRPAELALRRVLAGEPRNTQAMSNLVIVLVDLGRIEESRRIAAMLERLDPEPPFFWYHRGLAALRVDDFVTAKEAFSREVARAGDYHEFHFWLAVALSGLGEVDRAKEELRLALVSSTSRYDHDRYSAKLERLRELR